MSFLADLVTEILKDVLIVQVARSKNNSFLLGFGILTSIISVSLLFYLQSFPSKTVNNYSIKQIDYQVTTSNSKDGGIVLRSDPSDYLLSYKIWQDNHSRDYLVEALNKSRTATIWLDSPTSHTIKGITTSAFSISPEVGIAWDNKNSRWGIWLCWIFAGLGLVLIVLAALFY